FSDFFEQFFGSRGGRADGFSPFEEARGASGPFAHEEGYAQRGNDIEGDIMVTLDEALHGSIRPVSLQSVNPRTGQTETQTFRVKIPAGVQEGRLIRLPGKGGQGIGAGPPGDLYLRVKLAKHPDFRVRGSDVYYDLALAPWEAVLGA